ncbi:MAG TPA: hypothetical protein VGR14_20145 [Verrucomicrobiae bacterium]|jgi:hypothetical protein|nr:hypothetical protein [Verrucomicrobiae bacterium]
MTKLCVLFLHHMDNDLTRYHAELISQYNPMATLVPLTFRGGIDGAICPVEVPSGFNQWKNSDLLIYYWFRSKDYVAAERYLIIEYDTLCATSFEEFYAGVWDEPVAAAIAYTHQQQPAWRWFCEIRDQTPYQNKLAGLSPLSGILFSRAALAAISELAKDPLYASLYCECRIGTLARTSGYNPVRIRPDIAKYISWQRRNPTSPGIWHSVKTRIDLQYLKPEARSVG